MSQCNPRKEVLENRKRLQSINRHWNSLPNLTKQFGWAGGSKEGKDYGIKGFNAADRQLRDLMYEKIRTNWDEGLVISDADVKRVNLEIDRIENEMRKGAFSMNEAYVMTQVPSLVHDRLPSSRTWLNKTNKSISFERVSRERAAGQMYDIAGFIKAALIDVGAATKIGSNFKVDLVDKIRKYESQINSTEDMNARSKYYKELMDILNDPSTGGKVLVDYHTLVQMDNKTRSEHIKRTNGTKDEVNLNIINAVERTKTMLGTASAIKSKGKIVDYKPARHSLGGILIQSLQTSKRVAVKTHTNQSDMNSELVTNNTPLNNLLGKIDAQILSVKKSMYDGSYFPHRVFDNISKLRYHIEKTESVAGEGDPKTELVQMNNIMAELNTFRGEKQSQKKRLEILEAMWSRDPMSALELYMNETLTFNRNTYIKDFFIDAIRDLGNNGKITETTPEFIRGMHKYLTMQYRRSTSGFRGRPDWFNGATRTINGVQVMTTMGLGLPGAARNFLSGYYFHASQGLSVIRSARHDMKSDIDLIGDPDATQKKEIKGLLATAEEEAGFKFLERGAKSAVGLELVAEGINPVEGINLSKVDWVMDNQGKMHIQYDGKTPTGEIRDKLFSKAIQKSLVFHRIGENALRRNIWRIAFSHSFMERKNNQIWRQTVEDRATEAGRPNPKTAWKDEAYSFAKKIAQDAVNTFAFEYSVVNKAPIISGTAPELGADGMPKMGAKDYLTGTGSVIFQFMHYPMSFAAHQAKTLKGTYSGFVSGQGINNPDARNLLGLAGIYGTVALISTTTNTDLRRLMPNDTIERIGQIWKSFTGPEQGEAVYGLINQISGPTLNRMLFWAQASGTMDMPDTAIERALLGYQNYKHMSKSEQERALWNSFHVEFSRLKHKTIPALHRGTGLPDVAMQEFSLYPSRQTREWRQNVNHWTSKVGVKPFASRKVREPKKKPLSDYPMSEVYGAPKAKQRSNKQLRDLSNYITSRQ